MLHSERAGPEGGEDASARSPQTSTNFHTRRPPSALFLSNSFLSRPLPLAPRLCTLELSRLTSRLNSCPRRSPVNHGCTTRFVHVAVPAKRALAALHL